MQVAAVEAFISAERRAFMDDEVKLLVGALRFVPYLGSPIGGLMLVVLSVGLPTLGVTSPLPAAVTRTPSTCSARVITPTGSRSPRLPSPAWMISRNERRLPVAVWP